VSDAFERFVGLLGDKVELQGWTKFRAGLDVKSARARARPAPPIVTLRR